MPLDTSNIHETASQWLVAGIAAFVGRILALANLPVRPTGWALLFALLWEIPVAGAMGAIGLAVIDSSGLTGNAAYAALICVAYGGPRTIGFFVARWLTPRLPPAAPPKL